MINSDIIAQYLESKNTTLNEVLSTIRQGIPDDVPFTTVFYSSAMEGLGTFSSDIDVYVLIPKDQGLQYQRTYNLGIGIRVEKIKKSEFDIEYWPIARLNDFLRMLKKSDGITGDFNTLKVFLRLNTGYVIRNENSDWDIHFWNELQTVKLNNLIAKRFLLDGRSMYDDAIKLHRGGEALLAYEQLQRASWMVMSAANAIQNKANLKEKWIAKIFFSTEIGNDYKSFYEESFLSAFSVPILETRFDFVQNLMSELSFRGS